MYDQKPTAMKKRILRLILLPLLFPFAGFSSGIGIIDGSAGIYLDVVETHTSVIVQDQIARVTSTQILKNTTGSEVAFKYAFPLKQAANPISMRWFYAGQWHYATVSTQAQDTLIPGGNEGHIDPYLKAYLGDFPFFFTPRDPVGSDSLIVLELTYVELLPYFLNEVNFFQKNDFSHLQSDVVYIQTFAFTLLSEREILRLELSDPNYLLESDGHTAILTFTRHESRPDFDYIVDYELSSEGLGLTAFSTYLPDSIYTCDENGSGYISFIVEPESNSNTEVIEKNFSLIIDRSGSMSGNKIVQARDAASFIMQNLNAGDKFNIIDFNQIVTHFSDQLIPYTPASESEALYYISKLSAGGATNISGALTEAIGQFDFLQQDKANIILFFTDGLPTAGITSTSGILEAVADQVAMDETEIFLFAIGIGEDVDKGLLTLLARQNDGLVAFVDPARLEEQLVRLFLSVNNPVLLHTTITFQPDIIKEIYPYPFPNLYKGQQLIVSGRYSDPGPVNMHLAGKAFNLPVSYDFELSLADRADENLSFLPKIWAKQKLDALSIDYYLAETEAERETIAGLIDSLSLCYGVVALDFSSFEDGGGAVAIEKVEPENESPITAFPQPCADQLTIHIHELAGWQGVALVRLYTADKQLIRQETASLNNGILQLDGLSVLAPGLYIAMITVDGKQYAIWFVVG